MKEKNRNEIKCHKFFSIYITNYSVISLSSSYLWLKSQLEFDICKKHMEIFFCLPLIMIITIYVYAYTLSQFGKVFYILAEVHTSFTKQNLTFNLAFILRYELNSDTIQAKIAAAHNLFHSNSFRSMIRQPTKTKCPHYIEYSSR